MHEFRNNGSLRTNNLYQLLVDLYCIIAKIVDERQILSYQKIAFIFICYWQISVSLIRYSGRQLYSCSDDTWTNVSVMLVPIALPTFLTAEGFLLTRRAAHHLYLRPMRFQLLTNRCAKIVSDTGKLQRIERVFAIFYKKWNNYAFKEY